AGAGPRGAGVTTVVAVVDGIFGLSGGDGLTGGCGFGEVGVSARAGAGRWRMAVHSRAARSRTPMGTARAYRMAVTKATCAASRFCRTASTTALPSADPVWRVVLSTPEAAPAWAGSTLRVAMVCIGDIVKPTP